MTSRYCIRRVIGGVNISLGVWRLPSISGIGSGKLAGTMDVNAIVAAHHAADGGSGFVSFGWVGTSGTCMSCTFT